MRAVSPVVKVQNIDKGASQLSVTRANFVAANWYWVGGEKECIFEIVEIRIIQLAACLYKQFELRGKQVRDADACLLTLLLLHRMQCRGKALRPPGLHGLQLVLNAMYGWVISAPHSMLQIPK